MDVTQALGPQPGAAGQTGGGGGGGATTITSDFETFLQMLATQLQNQDPMNPVDASDYAVQLATFSSVEQQVLTNELLQGMTAQQNFSAMAGFAGWIGLEARSAAPAWFDGATPVEVTPNPLAAADRAELVIYGQDGTEAARRSVPLAAEPYLWDGKDADGVMLPPGAYTFTLENYQNGELQVTDPLETYGRVVESRFESGKVVLVLEGDIVLPTNAVTAIRDPEG